MTGALLTHACHDVEIVTKHPEAVEIGIGDGFHLRGVKGEMHLPVKAVRDVTDLTGSKDIILIATKAADCLDAARTVLPFLNPESLIVSLQNGICEEALSDVVGRDRTIGCVVGWGATLLGPGDLEITSTGEFVIGNIDHEPDDRLSAIRDVLDPVMPTRISENIMGELYSKLIVNSCINSLGAISGIRLGELLAIKKIRKIFIAIMREAMAVSEVLDFRVEPGGGGKLDFYRFLEGSGYLAEFKRHLTIRIIGFKYRRIRSSSLQSLERGRKTEIDFLNGYICDQGRRHGVPTPVNDAVVSMVKEIESGERPIELKNLDDPAFDGV